MSDTDPKLRAQNELEEYRKSIDNLDSALIAILAERFRVTEKVGRVKAAVGLPAMDPERELRQIEHFRERASFHDLNVDVAVDIFTRIFEHVKARHEVLQRGSASARSRGG